jgi:hypothetical protein
VRERPEAGAVALHDDRLPSSHPIDRRPAAEKRHEGRIVGVRGADDGGREAAFAVGRDEQVLARDLVARVLPVRVAQRRRLGDRQVPDGFWYADAEEM